MTAHWYGGGMTAHLVQKRAADPALPSLDTLLDGEALSQWLAAQGQSLVQRKYQRYKPGTSCVVAVELASGPAFLYGLAEAARPKLDKMIMDGPAGSVLAVDHERRLLLARMQADRDLPALRNLPAAVTSMWSAEAHLECRSLRTLIHKPQRRWVGVLTRQEQDPLVIRAYRRPGFIDAADRYRLVRSLDAVQVPKVAGKSRNHALLAVSHLAGSPLDRLVSTAGADDQLWSAVGAALARLHDHHRSRRSRIPAAAHASPSRTVALVSALQPTLAPQLTELLDDIDRRCPVANENTLCHGDFSADQVIISPDGVPGFIDFDRAGRADPATDLAGLLATGLGPSHGSAAMRSSSFQAVLAGYGDVRPIPDHLSWHLCVARLRRLADPFRAAQSDWACEIGRRLAELRADMS